jgi:cyclase
MTSSSGKTIRIIPRLDIKGPNLVKGIHLEGLRVLGNPEKFAKYYYEHGADELIYMDVVASLYGRNSLSQIIRKTAKDIFVPLTVGGGIRTIEDIRSILNAGADKVAINTAAVRNPEFISQASHQFGSSTIVLAIEAIRQPDGHHFAFTDCGREHTGIEVVEWAHRGEELGAGEIMISSVDNEGTGDGLDIELVSSISKAVGIPVIAHGGANTVENVSKAISRSGADAVAIASAFHYNLLKNSMSFSEQAEGNTEFLKSGSGFGKIKGFSIEDLKTGLSEHGIPCRIKTKGKSE